MRNHLSYCLTAGVLALTASCLNSGYPFSTVEDTTEIEYFLESSGLADAFVYDSCMGKVRTLVDSQHHDAGFYSVTWDLMDSNGNYPGDGLYTFEVYLDGERVFVSLLEVARK